MTAKIKPNPIDATEWHKMGKRLGYWDYFIASEIYRVTRDFDLKRERIIAEIKIRVPAEFKKHYKTLDADTLCADIVAKLVGSI